MDRWMDGCSMVGWMDVQWMDGFVLMLLKSSLLISDNQLQLASYRLHLIHNRCTPTIVVVLRQRL